jgi:hypothetical protein
MGRGESAQRSWWVVDVAPILPAGYEVEETSCGWRSRDALQTIAPSVPVTFATENEAIEAACLHAEEKSLFMLRVSGEERDAVLCRMRECGGRFQQGLADLWPCADRSNARLLAATFDPVFRSFASSLFP